MRALHYLAGDPPKSGYRVIGMDNDFPADSLPWLGIADRARVEVAENIPSGRCAQVWEFQTGDYGIPVVIKTLSITAGRSHAFSEYVMGEEENLTNLPLGKIIAAADADSDSFMKLENFLRYDLPKGDRQVIDSSEWNIDSAEMQKWDAAIPDSKWLQALLFHYWKQASLRAFSGERPETVHVFLKEYELEPCGDAEQTILHAKAFFSNIMDGVLPPQVRNIASVAAGTNNGDDLNYLITALQFDIAKGHPADAFTLEKIPEQYKLNSAQQQFMDEVFSGKKPALLEKLFENYRNLAERPDATEENTSFMADFSLWYDLFCLEHCIAEGHDFLEKSNLNLYGVAEGDLHPEERGKRNEKIGDARAYYLLQKKLRRTLRSHKKEICRERTEEEKGRDYTEQLLLPLEGPLYETMLATFNSPDAKPFLSSLSSREMKEYHSALLYQIPEEHYPQMIQLACADQKVAEKPNYIRACVQVPIRNANADQRNADFLSAYMKEVFHPLIAQECQKNEKTENPYLHYLIKEEFTKGWCFTGEKSKAAMDHFFLEEAKDIRPFFLTYRMAREYIPAQKLLCIALNHLTNEVENCQGANPITQQQFNVTKAARERCNMQDEEIQSALTDFYAACMLRFGRNVSVMDDVIRLLGGNTAPALVKVFTEKQTVPRMYAEEAKAYFESMAIPNDGVGCKDSSVAEAYGKYLRIQAARMLEAHQQDSSNPLPSEWLGSMLNVSKEYFTVDTSDLLIDLFHTAKAMKALSRQEAKEAFEKIDCQDKEFAGSDDVRTAYGELLDTLCDSMLEQKANPADSVANLIAEAPFKKSIDTSDILTKIFKDAFTLEPRMDASSAQAALKHLWPGVSKTDDVKSAYLNFLNAILEDSLSKKQNPAETLGNFIDATAGSLKDDIDSSDMLVKIFKAAFTLEPRMSTSSAGITFDKLWKSAKSTDAVKAAYLTFVNAVLDDEIAQKRNPADMMGDFVKATPEDFRDDIDTSDMMVKIFRAAFTFDPRMSASSAKTAFEKLWNNVKSKDSVKSSYLAFMNAVLDDALAQNINPSDLLTGLMESAPFKSDIDTSELMVRIFRAAGKFETRMDANSATNLFAKLGGQASSMEDLVRPAYRDMILEQEKRALSGENPEYSVAGWIAQMNNAIASGNAGEERKKPDTTEALKLLFDSHAKNMTTGDVRYAFEKLGEEAAELDSTVKNKFSAMLRKQVQENVSAVDAFTELREMLKAAPDSYKADESWKKEFHLLGIKRLCDVNEIDRNELRIMQEWLTDHSVDDTGITLIQRYCNARLEAGDNLPASMFLQQFESIDRNAAALKKYALETVSEAMRMEMLQSDAPTPADYVAITEKYEKEIKRYSYLPDDLYDQVDQDLMDYAKRIQERSDARAMIEVKDKPPIGKFRNLLWKLIREKVGGQQETLFNKQNSIQNLKKLHEDTLRFGEMEPSVSAAYQVIEGYEKTLRNLSQKSDYEIITDTRDAVERLRTDLSATGNVRATLCNCLRNEYHSVLSELKSHSFRHGLAGILFWATLSNEESKGPNWDAVRKQMLSNDQLSEASKKPFSYDSLPTLQTLLSFVETVEQMEDYSTSKGWCEGLLHSIHVDANCKKYLSALRRNKKQCERFGISFDENGKLKIDSQK